MAAILRRLPVLAGLAGLAAVGAELAGHRAFAHLVRRDVQALHARASPGPAGVVTEGMLTDLPDPVCRYLRYTGVVGRPFPDTIRLRQKGRMRPGPGQPWMPLDAEEHYSVQPPGFVWAGTAHLGPLPVVRARDMYAGGNGRMLVKVASLWPVVDASGDEMDQSGMVRYLSEMIWFPAAFLADNISFEPVDDSSARVTLTDHGRTATGTLSFDKKGRVTDFLATRYRWSPRTWWPRRPVPALRHRRGTAGRTGPWSQPSAPKRVISATGPKSEPGQLASPTPWSPDFRPTGPVQCDQERSVTGNARRACMGIAWQPLRVDRRSTTAQLPPGESGHLL